MKKLKICLGKQNVMKDKFKYNRLDKAEAAVLLIDHQTGLINLVQDYTPNEFRNNVLALNEYRKLL